MQDDDQVSFTSTCHGCETLETPPRPFLATSASAAEGIQRLDALPGTRRPKPNETTLPLPLGKVALAARRIGGERYMKGPVLTGPGLAIPFDTCQRFYWEHLERIRLV